MTHTLDFNNANSKNMTICDNKHMFAYNSYAIWNAFVVSTLQQTLPCCNDAIRLIELAN